jgi:hypothetical protein
VKKKLNIYIVETGMRETNYYDVLHGATVVAETPEEAVEITEGTYVAYCRERWTPAAKLVGVAAKGIEKGILLEDYLNG